MGCGCKTAPTAMATHASTRAALCHTCIYADLHDTDPWGIGAVGCGITGNPVLLHVQGQPCPLNKHPDGNGVVRWMWIRWWGLPMPLRLWLWATHPNHRRPGFWLACGCIVRLKALTARIFGTGASHGVHAPRPG